MNRTRWPSILVVATLVAVVAQSATLAVDWRVSIGPIEQRVPYRAATCPNGTTVVVNASGRVVTVNSAGAVSSRQELFTPAEGVSAVACSQTNRIYMTADGWLRSFDISGAGLVGAGEPVWIAGLTNQLAVTASAQTYALGLAKVGNSHVALRLFEADGSLRRTPAVGPELRSGISFNDLALNGVLLPHRDGIVFIPASPLEAWILDRDGKATLHKGLAGDGKFVNDSKAEIDVIGGPRAMRFDRVLSGATLPQGRILLHIAPLRGDSNGRYGWKYGYLMILDSNLDTVSTLLPPERVGMLSGAAADGTLYFVDLRANEGGSVVRARIAP